MNSAKSNIPKAPIYNPYDKFSKNDFDAWINDITGTLRKALSHQDEEPEPKTKKQDKWYYGLVADERNQPNGLEKSSSSGDDDDESSSEEPFDDSFAEISARRAKGKARDPREGPGLRAGTFHEPIELDSDDDDDQETGEEGEDSADDFEEEQEVDERGVGGEEEEEGDDDDDEEEEEEEEEEEDHQFGFRRQLVHREKVNHAPSGWNETKDNEEQDMHDDERKITKESATQLPSNGDSEWADDADSTLDVPGEVAPVAYDIEDDEEEQQLDSNDSAFPLDVEGDALFESQPIDLPDIWAGPKTYAEDFYSGGDIIQDSTFPVNADVLNEYDGASDSGNFLTPGLLTPNGIHAATAAPSAAPSPGDILLSEYRGSHEAEADRAYSPMPGSSPLEISPDPEVFEEVEHGRDRPSPEYILSDDGDEEATQYHITPLSARSSPPAEYDQVQDDHGSDADIQAEEDEDEYSAHQDGPVDVDMAVDVAANDTILPLGTSDLDILEESDPESQEKTVDEREQFDELYKDKDVVSAHEDLNAAPQEDEVLIAESEPKRVDELPSPPPQLVASEEILQIDNDIEAPAPPLQEPVIIEEPIAPEDSAVAVEESVVIEETPIELPEASAVFEDIEKASPPPPESVDIAPSPTENLTAEEKVSSLPLESAESISPVTEALVAEEASSVQLLSAAEDPLPLETLTQETLGEPSASSAFPGSGGDTEEENKEVNDIDNDNDRDAYSVIEILSEDEGMDSDADGDFEIETVAGEDNITNEYEVEEIMTEGRLTVEPDHRERSTSFSLAHLPDPAAELESLFDAQAEPQDAAFMTERTAVSMATVSFDVQIEPVADIAAEASDLLQTSTALDVIGPSQLPMPIPAEDSSMSSMDVSVPEQEQPDKMTEADVFLGSIVIPNQEAEELTLVPTSLSVPVDDVLLPEFIALDDPFEEPPLAVTNTAGDAPITVDDTSVNPESELSSSSDAPSAPNPIDEASVILEGAAPPSSDYASAPIPIDEVIVLLGDESPSSSDNNVSLAAPPIPIGDILAALEEESLDTSDYAPDPANEVTATFERELPVSSDPISLSTALASIHQDPILSEGDLPISSDSISHTDPSSAFVDNSPTPLAPALLTRNAIPVLHADPYPASLSTPDIIDMEEAEEDQEPSDDEIDEIDPEDDSPSSSIEQEKAPDNPGWSPLTDDSMSLELQYPETEGAILPVSVVPTGPVQKAEDLEDLDSDAEGDVDPDFAIEGSFSSSATPVNGVTLADAHPEHENPDSSGPALSASSLSGLQAVVEELDTTATAPALERGAKIAQELIGEREPVSETSNQSNSTDGVMTLVNGTAAADAETHPSLDEDISPRPEKAQSEPRPAVSTPAAENRSLAESDTRLSETVTQLVEHPAINPAPSALGDAAVQTESSSLNLRDSDSSQSPSTKKAADTNGIIRKPKRKRKTPVTMQTSPHPTEKKLFTRRPVSMAKGKGKEKEVLPDISDSASNSSASAAARMLTGSRASSVASTSTVDGIVTSPTPLRTKHLQSTAPPPPPPPPPLPQLMFHNHSRKPVPLRPTLTLQTQLQKTIPRAPSFHVNAGSSSQQVSPMAGSSPSTPAPSQSPHILRREPSSNSPVTRSHCRYHKISLPEEEDSDMQIFFLVPGCSLVDRKVMKEEEIMDHGDATYDDSMRKVADIETLHINDYVLGVIRLLVGPDKEHEVFFLPKPGEERARKVIHRKSHLSKSNSSSGHGYYTSANGSIFSPSSSTRGPVSVAGSTSTTRSGKERRRSYSPALTDTDVEDNGEQDSPNSKRAKFTHPPRESQSSASMTDLPQGSNQDQVLESASAGPGSRTTKRKRPLDESAAAYTPGTDEDNESEVEESTKTKKKKNGLKKTRTLDASNGTSTTGNEEPGRKRKRMKTLKMIPYGFAA